MKALTILGIALVAIGVLALVYEGFSYTTERQVADIGIAQLTTRETETIPIPAYVGVTLVAAGVGVILLAKRKAE